MDKVLFEIQEMLEYRTSNKHVDLYFEEERNEFTREPLMYIVDYICACADKDYTYYIQSDTEKKHPRTRTDLKEIDAWLCDEENFELIDKTLYRMMCLIYTSKLGTTAQALAGVIFNKVEFSQYQSRVKLASILMDAIATSPYVQIENTPDKIYFKPTIELDMERQREIAHLGHPLPMIYAPRVKNNKSVGYLTQRIPMLAGGPLKQHDKDICLDHFNRLNATEYTIELRMGQMYEPKFNPKAKVKKNGEWETILDIQKRKEQFDLMVSELPLKIGEMVKQGNRFYIPHYADNRIRTYAKAYHFNYQGAKWTKAAVQFKKKEIVKPEF